MDKTLPFSLRSAPKIFTAAADALEWVLRANGVHYIDDFLTAGRPGSPECSTHLEIIKRVCAVLGFPLKWEKMAGPCTLIEFLGILLDTIKMELRLPEEKVQQLVELLDGRRLAGRESYCPSSGSYPTHVR